MDRSIIHNNDRPWTWIWRTEGKERVFDKILKKFSCKRAVLNIPCQHTIHCICRKDGPTFTAFEFMVFMRSDSNRCPSVLSIACAFVCSRFINKYQLFCLVVRQFSCPGCTEFRVPLGGSSLDLEMRKTRQYQG